MEEVLAVNKGERPTALAVDESTPQHQWARQALEKPFIDVEYRDPAFADFVVDTETDDTELGVHIVSGHIGGTTIRYNIYLPPKAGFKNRFFQYAYPVQTADALPADIAFGAYYGAYTFQCTGMLGFRQEAAGAAYSRRFAADYYGVDAKEIYGYVYGGSGGSFVTIGAMENTYGVWQGAVPFVQAWMYSMPNTQTIGCLTGLVLGDKIEQIADAVAPGGSGDPFDVDLSDMQRSILREVLDAGVPPRSLEILRYDSPGPLQLLQIFHNQTRGIDPTYCNDFWTKEGYVGTEHSDLGDFFRSRRAVGEVNVTGRHDGNGLTFDLGDLSHASELLAGADLWLQDGGERVNVVGQVNGSLFTCWDEKTAAFIKAGSVLHYDNSNYLAFHLYHRHTLPPTPSPWDTILRLADGTPRYPQRPINPGPLMASGPIGAPTMTGKTFAKMIVVQNLLDSEAWPWKADWYRSQVAQAYGDSSIDDVYRLWFVDNANHWNGKIKRQEDVTRIVHYDGHYYRALLELADWVEKGVTPARTHDYIVEKGQVRLLDSDTGGIQPRVTLTVGGQARAVVKAGIRVELRAKVIVPEGQGKVVRVEWDVEGRGDFKPHTGLHGAAAEDDFVTTHVYDTAAVYLPAVRVAGQKTGDVEDKHALAFNLGRARVVVE